MLFRDVAGSSLGALRRTQPRGCSRSCADIEVLRWDPGPVLGSVGVRWGFPAVPLLPGPAGCGSQGRDGSGAGIGTGITAGSRSRPGTGAGAEPGAAAPAPAAAGAGLRARSLFCRREPGLCRGPGERRRNLLVQTLDCGWNRPGHRERHASPGNPKSRGCAKPPQPSAGSSACLPPPRVCTALGLPPAVERVGLEHGRICLPGPGTVPLQHPPDHRTCERSAGVETDCKI
ncbi:uncharacterized protein LOC117010914 [Catharus ustulatus]|uniref:uncharacterized protein LOC117010914 n=1 Tax=Catharus ustulatus TaxID=91951 RepID=UPI00140C2B68|nr:uncharacterized protein LOC117010914 [Catharus ustulatus]